MSDIEKAEDMSADNLILACKGIFSEFGLPKKIMSDMGGNFISNKFRQFCKIISVEQATSSSLYHHQSNKQVEACIKFIQHTMKKCFKTKEHMGEVSIITDHKTLVAIFKRRHSYIIIEAAVNPTKNTSIHGEDYVQAWTRPIHGRLAVQT